MGPASRRATLMPRSVRTLTAVPPPAPEPITTTSKTWGLRLTWNMSNYEYHTSAAGATWMEAKCETNPGVLKTLVEWLWVELGQVGDLPQGGEYYVQTQIFLGSVG